MHLYCEWYTYVCVYIYIHIQFYILLFLLNIIWWTLFYISKYLGNIILIESFVWIIIHQNFKLFLNVMNNIIIILYINLNFFMIFLVEMSKRGLLVQRLWTLLRLLMCMTLLKYCTKFCSVYTCTYQFVTKRSERFFKKGVRGHVAEWVGQPL